MDLTAENLETIPHDPGGKRLYPIQSDMVGDVIFGGNGDCYRYALGRTWDATRPAVMVIGMNPSTANPFMDDPTIAKLCRMARRWQTPGGDLFGALLMVNTFAYRSTD